MPNLLCTIFRHSKFRTYQPPPPPTPWDVLSVRTQPALHCVRMPFRRPPPPPRPIIGRVSHRRSPSLRPSPPTLPLPVPLGAPGHAASAKADEEFLFTPTDYVELLKTHNLKGPVFVMTDDTRVPKLMYTALNAMAPEGAAAAAGGGPGAAGVTFLSTPQLRPQEGVTPTLQKADKTFNTMQHVVEFLADCLIAAEVPPQCLDARGGRCLGGARMFGHPRALSTSRIPPSGRRVRRFVTGTSGRACGLRTNGGNGIGGTWASRRVADPVFASFLPLVAAVHTFCTVTPPPPGEVVVVRSPCQENDPADAHPSALKSVLESAKLGGCIWMHLVKGTGNSPVSGTADPRSSQTGQVIRGLRGHNQNTFGPTEGRDEQWQEANRRRQRHTIRYRGLVPTPPPPPFGVQRVPCPRNTSV